MCFVQEHHPAASDASDMLAIVDGSGLRHCITDWKPIYDYIVSMDPPHRADNIRDAIENHLMRTRELYAALVDAGIPWQDARRVLPIGMQTYIHDQYNYLALSGVLTNRLEHVMDWEHNCVANSCCERSR